MKSSHKKLIELVPAFRKGELTPAQAHEVATALKSDPEFALESERERVVVEALAELDELPVPRGLVARSVKKAAGSISSQKWFSLDTILVALGVGVACAAVAQLITSKITVPFVGKLLIDLAKFAAGNAFDLLSGAYVVTLVILGVGAWLALKITR